RRSTSSAQVDGQSCGQALCTMSGLGTASKSINMSGPHLAARSKIPRVPRLYPPLCRNSRARRASWECIVTSLASSGELQFKPRLGVLYMLSAILVLGSTDAIVKWTSANVDPIQIGFSRFVVSLIMVLWLVGHSEAGFSALRTKRPIEHAARAFCA